MQLFLVWDEESEVHLENTMLSNAHTTVDASHHRESGRKRSRKDSSSDEAGHINHGDRDSEAESLIGVHVN